MFVVAAPALTAHGYPGRAASVGHLSSSATLPAFIRRRSRRTCQYPPAFLPAGITHAIAARAAERMGGVYEHIRSGLAPRRAAAAPPPPTGFSSRRSADSSPAVSSDEKPSDHSVSDPE